MEQITFSSSFLIRIPKWFWGKCELWNEICSKFSKFFFSYKRQSLWTNVAEWQDETEFGDDDNLSEPEATTSTNDEHTSSTTSANDELASEMFKYYY